MFTNGESRVVPKVPPKFATLLRGSNKIATPFQPPDHEQLGIERCVCACACLRHARLCANAVLPVRVGKTHEDAFRGQTPAADMCAGVRRLAELELTASSVLCCGLVLCSPFDRCFAKAPAASDEDYRKVQCTVYIFPRVNCQHTSRNNV